MLKQISISISMLMIMCTTAFAQDANGRNWLIYCQSGNVDAIDVTKCNDLMTTYGEAMASYNHTKRIMLQAPNFETGELGEAIDDYNYYKLETEYQEDRLEIYDGDDDYGYWYE